VVGLVLFTAFLVGSSIACGNPNCHCTSRGDCYCPASTCTCFPCGKGPPTPTSHWSPPANDTEQVNYLRRQIVVNQTGPQGNTRVQVVQGPLGATRQVYVNQQQYQQPQYRPQPLIVEERPRIIQVPQYEQPTRRIEVEIVPAIRMIEGMPYIQVGPNSYIATPESLVQRQPQIQLQIQQPQIQYVQPQPQIQYIQPQPQIQYIQQPQQQLIQLPPQQYPQQQYVQQPVYQAPRYRAPIYDAPVYSPPTFRSSSCPNGNCPLR
jgi:hypothetical protein